jgi:hypothetical protein
MFFNKNSKNDNYEQIFYPKKKKTGNFYDGMI